MRTHTRILVEKHSHYGGGAINEASDADRVFHIKDVVFAEGRYHQSYTALVGQWVDEKAVRELGENRFNQVVVRAAK